MSAVRPEDRDWLPGAGLGTGYPGLDGYATNNKGRQPMPALVAFIVEEDQSSGMITQQTISTRRFCWRPASRVLSAIGRLSP